MNIIFLMALHPLKASSSIMFIFLEIHNTFDNVVFSDVVKEVSAEHPLNAPLPIYSVYLFSMRGGLQI